MQEDRIFLLSLLMAEMGVHSVAYAFPRVHIITTAVDKRVSEEFHIIPGIGEPTAGTTFPPPQPRWGFLSVPHPSPVAPSLLLLLACATGLRAAVSCSTPAPPGCESLVLLQFLGPCCCIGNGGVRPEGETGSGWGLLWLFSGGERQGRARRGCCANVSLAPLCSGNFGDRYFGTDAPAAWLESESMDC